MKFRKTGLFAIVATTLCATLLGAGTASAAATKRVANYGAQQCIVSDTAGNILAGPCSPTTRLKQFTWSGVVNGTSTFRNVGTGKCLDSNTAGSVYTIACNGSDNQYWVVIQRAAGSALLLQNLETRRYLYQKSGGFYGTTSALNLSDPLQRWTIG